MNVLRLSHLLLLSSALGLARIAAGADRGTVDFVAHVRPILQENCVSCHGPEEQKANLRLDNRERALQGGESGAVIEPGNPDESRLIQLVSGADPELRMPPKGERLNAEQIATLRHWIQEGAVWPEGASTRIAQPDHWAFVPPARPAVPSPRNAAWVRNPIDAFVLDRLEKENLHPSPEADKNTLLRRLSLDLIGLPPSVAELDEFLNDASPGAYERQVERLLNSPHYGERWGRHWLDAARYADSDGYEKDKSRTMWFYRDWVVRAFNRDLPYDQFIIEQLAGDLLPEATQDQIVATGFLRNSMINEEGGVDPEQFRMDAMFDRMDCIGKSVLGLTIQCAQCHDHKYDPISQVEYYQLFAFINNDHEAQQVVHTPDELMKRANLRGQIQEIEAELQRVTPGWREQMRQWEASVSKEPVEWTIVHPVVEDISTGGQRYLPREDGSFLAQGYAPTKHTVRLWLTNEVQNVTAFRLELLTDPVLPAGGPGRSFKGTCALTEFYIDAAPAGDPSKKSRIKFAGASSDYDQPVRPLGPNFYDRSTNNRVTGPIAMSIDGDHNTAWGIDAGPGRRNQPRKAVFLCSTNIGFEGGTIFTFHIAQNHGGWNSDDHMNNNLGRFRLSYTMASGPVTADPIPARVRELLAIPEEQRSPAQSAALFSYWRSTVPEWAEANQRIEELWKQMPEGASTFVLMARGQSRETRLLKRGDWLKPLDAVQAGVPSVLHPLPENADDSRLTFARWLVDRRSPTTARVFVNRLWQAYFGRGLVSTPEDFGLQSEPPSHPELLDWLACEFMDSGWRIKQMHRLIVTSSTYRQSSRIAPGQFDRDPYNRLLARGPRFRVEGEIVRDIALAASGLLNPKLGGPSVMPPAPEYLFQPPASYAPFPWKSETGPEKYRRALYTFRRRSTPYPMLQTFDVPNGDFSCVNRLRSNSPLQALVTLNEPLFIECARALGRAMIDHGTADSERLVYGFRSVLARRPEPDELEQLQTLIDKQRKRIADGWLNPSRIALGTPEPSEFETASAAVTPANLAAYTIAARVLLNLDEAITKE